MFSSLVCYFLTISSHDTVYSNTIYNCHEVEGQVTISASLCFDLSFHQETVYNPLDQPAVPNLIAPFILLPVFCFPHLLSYLSQCICKENVTFFRCKSECLFIITLSGLGFNSLLDNRIKRSVIVYNFPGAFLVVLFKNTIFLIPCQFTDTT